MRLNVILYSYLMTSDPHGARSASPHASSRPPWWCWGRLCRCWCTRSGLLRARRQGRGRGQWWCLPRGNWAKVRSDMWADQFWNVTTENGRLGWLDPTSEVLRKSSKETRFKALITRQCQYILHCHWQCVVYTLTYLTELMLRKSPVPTTCTSVTPSSVRNLRHLSISHGEQFN